MHRGRASYHIVESSHQDAARDAPARVAVVGGLGPRCGSRLSSSAARVSGWSVPSVLVRCSVRPWPPRALRGPSPPRTEHEPDKATRGPTDAEKSGVAGPGTILPQRRRSESARGGELLQAALRHAAHRAAAIRPGGVSQFTLTAAAWDAPNSGASHARCRHHVANGPSTNQCLRRSLIPAEPRCLPSALHRVCQDRVRVHAGS